MMRQAVLLVPLVLAAPAAARPLGDLALPIACAPGADCWVLRYVDHDPGLACATTCAAASPAMATKAPISRSAIWRPWRPGWRCAPRRRAWSTRCAMAWQTRASTRSAAPPSAAKECGNGIRLAHGDGWTTWYCHLRRGSLMVRQGDRVAAGQPLGLVGLSGDTSFPHFHFDVRHGERVVDPFVGSESAADCGPGRQSLWAPDVMAQLSYQPVLLTDAGVATAAPDKDDVRRGWHRLSALPLASPALVLWVEVYWVAPGDRVTFRLRGPDGATVVDHAMEIDKGQPRWLGFAGASRPGDRWPPGTYAGEVALERAAASAPQRVMLERSVELVER